VNDQTKSDDQPEPETEVSEEPAADTAPPAQEYAQPSAAAEEPRTPRRWVPSTPAGKSRLVAAGVAGAFFVGGGLGGYAIGQANDGPDRPGFSRPDFDGQQRGPGGPGGGPGQQQSQPDQQQAPGDTSGSGTPS